MTIASMNSVDERTRVADDDVFEKVRVSHVLYCLENLK